MKPDFMEPEKLAKALKLDDGAGFLLRVLTGRATGIYEELTGQTDITPQQFGVLLTLYQQGTMTLGEVAKATRADLSTIGEMARRMTARGLVTRAAGRKDRRTVSISITRDGTAALLALIPKIPALQQRLLAPLDPGQRRPFLQNLKRLAGD